MGVQTTSIAANLQAIRERMGRAAERAGRKPDEVTLVVISKMFPPETIRLAYAAGVRHFGENRVQEWEAKQPLLKDLDATWHLVGHLQSNKAARAVRLFDAIDSLDSIPLAQKVGRVAAEHGRRLPVLIEVHLGSELTKTGASEVDLPALAEAVSAQPRLDLRGLMCIPPFFDNPEHVRAYFRRLRELRDALRRHLAQHLRHPEGSESSLIPELSMGMSHDFEVAIEEGATQVRLGTAIFGPRPPQ